VNEPFNIPYRRKRPDPITPLAGPVATSVSYAPARAGAVNLAVLGGLREVESAPGSGHGPGQGAGMAGGVPRAAPLADDGGPGQGRGGLSGARPAHHEDLVRRA